MDQPAPPPETNSPLPVSPAPTVTQNKSGPKFPKFLVPLVLLVLVVFVGVSFLLINFKTDLKPPLNSASPTPEKISTLTPGKLIIGTEATFEPMEFIDSQGNLSGYDIDLGNKIAEQLGLSAEFKNLKWDDVFTALENRQIDVIISSVTITEERKQKYIFSVPYINAGQVVITQKDNTTINSVNDLSGKKIAVQRGTTNEEQALKYTDQKLVLQHENFVDATQSLLDNRADAIFADLTVAKGIISEHPDLKIASEPFTSDYYGVVFRKDEVSLTPRINFVLNLLRQQGILVYLKQKWLE